MRRNKIIEGEEMVKRKWPREQRVKIKGERLLGKTKKKERGNINESLRRK